MSKYRQFLDMVMSKYSHILNKVNCHINPFVDLCVILNMATLFNIVITFVCRISYCKYQFSKVLLGFIILIVIYIL